MTDRWYDTPAKELFREKERARMLEETRRRMEQGIERARREAVNAGQVVEPTGSHREFKTLATQPALIVETAKLSKGELS